MTSLARSKRRLTVQELIDRLKELPPDFTVSTYFGSMPIIDLIEDYDNDNICLVNYDPD